MPTAAEMRKRHADRRRPHMSDGGGVPDWATAPVPDWAAGAPSQPATSTAQALLEGFKKGLSANFSDEIYGASQSAGLPDWLGGFRAPVGAARLGYEYMTGQPGAATEAYNKGVEFARARQAAAEAQHPTASMVGELGGAGLGAVALPIESAATFPGRIAQGAKIGATYGTLSGAGEGTDLGSRAAGAGIGAITGGLTGAVAPPVVEGAIQGGKAITQPIINTVRGAIDPEAEAARRVTTAVARDYAQTGPALGPEEIAAANLAGTPRGLVDAGGETTLALARSAANTSPEARQALKEFTENRFAGQNDRAASVIQSITGASGDNAATIDSLKEAAERINSPRYKKVMDANPVVGVPSDITDRPVIQQAMKDAVSLAKNRGEKLEAPPDIQTIIAGPGYHIADEVPNSGQPSLRYWDYVKKALDARINGMMRKGGIEELDSKQKADLGGLLDAKKALVAHLDDVAPDYKAARAGAASAFSAQDALEAGSNFLSSRMENGAARRAFQALSTPEKELFRQGYASAIISKIREMGDRRTILNAISQSPAERERMELALGPQGARQMEAFLRAEGVLDRARTAVSGNSTTARQLAELGLAGGAYGLTSGGDLTNPRAVATGALVWGLTHGNRRINETVARRVGEMLVSDDPGVIKRGVQMAARHANILDGLRRVDGFGVGAAAQPAATSSSRIPIGQMQGLAPANADQNQQQ